MWSLQSEKENEVSGPVFHVLADEELQVGRKACDIVIVKDASVSRKHASIRTSHPMSNVGKLKFNSVCTLKDCGSKYGTFVNGNQVQDHGVILKVDDLITFGQCGSNYRVRFEPVVVTTSCLEPAEKSSLKENVRKLGGHVVDEWNTDCTHLVMSKIKVTVKTVCALVSDKPIVSIAYFKMLVDSHSAKKQPEKPENFLPPVGEALLSQESVTFSRNADRSKLFKDQTFIFLTAHQYVKLRLPITLGGGKTVLKNRSRCDITQALLLSSIVIQYPAEGEKNPNSQSQSQICTEQEITEIENLLQDNNRRFIAESDIGLAVIHCSVEQYCNPEYVFESASVSNRSFKLQSQTLSQNYVYVPETQPSTAVSKSSGMRSSVDKEIPPTFRPSLESSVLTDKENVQQPSVQKKKRSASSEAKEKPASKVLKTEDAAERKDGDTQLHTSVNLGSFDLDSGTQPWPTNPEENPSNRISDGGKKRPLCASETNLSTERHSRSQDAETQLRILQTTSSIKVEAPSPPPQDSVIESQNLEFNLNANTQPASENFIKEEIEEVETFPVKRQRLDSDSRTEQQRTSVLSKASTSRSASKGGFLRPTGFLDVSKSQKARKELATNEAAAIAEEELPSHLIVVELADLVINRSRPTTRQIQTSTVKNFKKFRKTAHSGANHLPTIIGGNDLIVHTSKENLNEINEFLLQQETEHTQATLDDTCNTSFRARF